MTLGSASFEFLAQNQDLIVKGAQAEAAAKANYKAIADAAGVSAASVERAANRVAAAQKAEADASAASALKIIKAHNDAADAAEKAAQKTAQANARASSGFGDVAKGALAMGAAFAGVTLGIEGARKALESVTDATLKSQQASRSLSAAYGESAGQFKKFADDLAASLGKTNAEVETGVARMAILQKQYGITSAEVEKLTKVALDLGAAFGDSDEAIRSVQAAIRGEPEALEKYGIALQQNAIQNNDLLTESEKKNFQNLDAVTQARIRYRIILAESAQFEGTAAARTAETAGQFDKAHRATDELAKAIGESLVPGLGRIASGWADATNALAAYIQKSKEAELDAEQMGVPGALARAGLDPATGKPPVPGSVALGPLLGPSVADVKAINDQIEAETRRHEDEQAQIIIDGLHKIKEARDKDLDEQKRAAERALKQRLDDLDAEKKAQLDAIHEQAQAAAEASRVRIAQLQVEEQAAKQAVEHEKQDTLDGIAVARQAADEAAADQIKRLQAGEQAEKSAIDQHHKDVIDGLDADKRVRDDARVQEDRALRDEIEGAKRLEDERHQTVVRGLDDEVKKSNETKEQRLRHLDELSKRASAAHTQRLRELEDEADHDQKRHDATVATLASQEQTAQRIHEATTQRLSSEGEAAQKEHERVTREQEERLAAAAAIHEKTLANLDAEAQRESDKHDGALRQIESESQAATARHEQALEALRTEDERAQQAHDDAIRQIDRQRAEEDDRHRSTLANIDAEQKAREDAIDAQLRALDDADKAASNASAIQGLQDRVATARTGVAAALNTGNQATIDAANRALLAAEQALRDGQTKIARDALRQQLQDQKATIGEEISAERAAENERARLAKLAADQAKQAADDELKRVQALLAARREEADQELKHIQSVLSARQQAEDDAYAGIQRTLKARREAADAEYKLVVDDVAAKRRAEDDKLKATQERLAHEKQAADETYANEKARLDQQKKDADDALKLAKDRIDAEKRAEDDKYILIKDRLDKRKVQFQDANKAELEGIAARKLAEGDAHDRAIIQAADQFKQRKDGIDDLRRKENEADADRRKQADLERDEANERTRQIYRDPITGLIPAVEAARHAADEGFDAQRTAAERSATAQIAAINSTYNDPIKGLIPLAQAAERATARAFQNQAADVQASFEAQRAAAQAAYRAPDGKSGILDQIDESKRLLDEQLRAEEERWKNYRQGLTGPDGIITKSWEEALKAARAYFDEVDARRKAQAGAGAAPGGGGSAPAPGGGSNPGGGNPNARPGQPGGPYGPGVPGGPSIGSGGPGAPNKTDLTPAAQLMPQGVTSWLQAAMRLTNDDGQELAGLLNLTAQESSGNPAAVNPQAAIDRNGNNLGHATGLLQTLPGTFASNALSGHGNIFDPIDNAAAAIRYIAGRYGSVYNTPYYSTGIFNTQGVGGYAAGGFIADPHILVSAATGRPDGIMAERGGEWIVPQGAMGAGGMGDTHIHLEGAQIYDAARFEDRLVSALHRADRRGRINLTGLG